MAWGKVLLVLLALATTWGSPWRFSEASNGPQQIKTTPIEKGTFTLPSNCQTSCGDISIQYPFGIGDGCYLPGFGLTCFEQYDSSVPTQLFMGGDGTLEVTGINLYSGYVYFKLPVISMAVDQSFITVPLIDLQNYHNFNFWATNNVLFVSGCNVHASLVDLAKDNTIIANCSTICLDVGPDSSPIRREECSVPIRKGIRDRVFLGVRLTRLDQTNATAVSAYVSSSIGSSDFKLSWYMDDHSSCREAMSDMETYACISNNSGCYSAFSGEIRDVTVGYYCSCSGGNKGNPYLTDGCQGLTTANIYPAKNCTRKCASVDIPFPFGLDTESDCYRDSSFALVCNQTATPPVLQYQGKNVSEVDVESGELHLMEVRKSSQGLTLTERHSVHGWSIPYHSCEDAKMNKSLFACVSNHTTCLNINGSKGDQLGYRCQCEQGCAGNPYVLNGCKDVTTPKIYPAGDCTRKCGSVDIPFPFGLDNESDCYRDSLFALFCNQTTTPPVLLYQGINVSEVGVERGELSLIEMRNSSQGFTLIEGHYSWLIPNHSCEDAKRNKSILACVSERSTCYTVNGGNRGQLQLGYRCQCEQGYAGNPYVLNGCQDINECGNSTKYTCKGICANTEGSYNCTCEPGTFGDPKIGECIPHTKKRTIMLVLIIAASNVCLLLLCIMLVILSKKWKERMQKQIREKNFHQNHGLLLKQLISTSEHDAERTKLFALEEIEKATNNFHETRLVGRGGHGEVYKGILSDQRVVAVKKSTNLKKSEIDEFINEVAILSQINHRHIVKLFGCCLETEIPLLIYEFISNDTLSHHLHVPNGQSKLSWDDRLRIATEIACSLAYLHSDVSMSIFHRDVKSSNILLDDNLVAKVSDFGASRFIPLDQNYVHTVVQGTIGYLDPEYYQTSELTEKSDVYSFGVILLELLTGKAPIYSNEHGDEVNLSKQFLQAMRENHALDVVEDRVLKEGNKEELLEIMQMIEICLSLKGAERPTMKEVEYKLQGLRRIRMTKKRLPSFAEDNEATETNLSDAFDPSTELVDQRNQGTSTSYSSEKEMMYQRPYSPR
ncbi:wall-associated receptor kinase 1-like [Zingiber officinale]|uniref:Protein kinase domain-containing protein n=1 Tax=Zingiber officinale TaxID=94328 RepID=A0A8J5F9E2_ZINOF|nr:wall-associated receptor kinase 1-like [Zingiber officinale]KAG6480741.1 hypothetical protein ZIOFF_057326 [Zingiber officinale]